MENHHEWVVIKDFRHFQVRKLFFYQRDSISLETLTDPLFLGTGRDVGRSATRSPGCARSQLFSSWHKEASIATMVSCYHLQHCWQVSSDPSNFAGYTRLYYPV
jgi:hypothetical protein